MNKVDRVASDSTAVVGSFYVILILRASAIDVDIRVYIIRRGIDPALDGIRADSVGRVLEVYRILRILDYGRIYAYDEAIF